MHILPLLTFDLNVPTADWLKILPMDPHSKPRSHVINFKTPCSGYQLKYILVILALKALILVLMFNVLTSI